jgi:phospholipid/cholesterol/gamma-HCH transport system ATP-binding protein
VSAALPSWLHRHRPPPLVLHRPERGAPLICFEHLSKAFGEHVVFDDLSLTVTDGETLTVIGGSGTGKSVLLKCLVGLVAPDAGRVVFEGQDLSLCDERAYGVVRRSIAMVFQNSALFDSLTVAQNVAWPMLERDRTLGRDELDERVHQKLLLVDLPDAGPLKPSELSGGMRKRVGLARALANDPDVILWDEPTTGLDPLSTHLINDLICQMHRDLKCTSVVVTHDMRSAFRVSDRIAMLAHGRIIEVGSVAQMKASAEPDVRAFLDAEA